MYSLQKLLSKVEQFYKLASNYFLYSNAQQENLYDSLVEIAKSIKDTDVKDELLVVADLYKASVNMGKGFSTVNHAIKNFMNEFDEIFDTDEDEENPLENILNEIVVDLRNRAGGAAALKIEDSPEVKRQLHDVKLQSEFSREDEGQSPYEAGLGFASSTDEDVKYNPLLEGGGKDGAKINTGFGISRVYTPQDKIKIYQTEINRYLEDVKEASKEHPKIIEWTQELIKILYALQKSTLEHIEVQTDLINVPEDPELQERNKEIEKELKLLRTTRNKIKDSIRIYYNRIDRDKLARLADKATGLEKTKLEQEALIKDLTSSRDLGKSKELELRRKIVKTITETPPGDIQNKIIKDLLSQAEEAKKQRIPISKIHKQRATQIRQLKLSGSLKGLTVKLGQDVAARKMHFKKAVVAELIKNKIKSEKDGEFKQYLNEITKAAAAGNKADVKLNATQLAKHMAEFAKQIGYSKTALVEADNDPKIQLLTKAFEPFYNFRDSVNNLTTLSPDLLQSEDVAPIVESIIKAGETLMLNTNTTDTINNDIANIVNQLRKDLISE